MIFLEIYNYDINIVFPFVYMSWSSCCLINRYVFSFFNYDKSMFNIATIIAWNKNYAQEIYTYLWDIHKKEARKIILDAFQCTWCFAAKQCVQFSIHSSSTISTNQRLDFIFWTLLDTFSLFQSASTWNHGKVKWWCISYFSLKYVIFHYLFFFSYNSFTSLETDCVLLCKFFFIFFVCFFLLIFFFVHDYNTQNSSIWEKDLFVY